MNLEDNQLTNPILQVIYNDLVTSLGQAQKSFDALPAPTNSINYLAADITAIKADLLTCGAGNAHIVGDITLETEHQQ